MKNYLLKSIFILIVLVSFLGCSSDDSTPEPCTPIACLNGGISNADCGCDCPQGYSGANCSTQITPAKIFITKIRVIKFPNLKPDGSYWDSFSGIPDIYVQVLRGTTLVYDSPTFFEDVVSTSTSFFDFTPALPIEITTFNTPYIMSLFDYDTTGSDENMGFIGFFPYTNTAGFPSTLTVKDDTKSLHFELTLTYQW